MQTQTLASRSYKDAYKSFKMVIGCRIDTGSCKKALIRKDPELT